MGDMPDWVVLDHLGDAYLAVGRSEEAARAWGKAAEALRGDQVESRGKVDEDVERIQAKILGVTAPN